MHLDEWVRKQREALTAQRLWRDLVPLTGPRGRQVQTAQGATLLSFSSNDYLGLSSHPDLARAAADAATRHGTSTASSRLLSGTALHHLEAEAALASFVGHPAALLFASGYAANVGTLPAVASREDLILSDELNHASLIDGCRLSRATIERYPHGNVDAVRAILAQRRSRFRHALVVTDALFSMDADVADLATLSSLCREYDAWLYVDEAHSLGVLGPQGRGLASAQEVVPDILVGTLGKSFGLHGAFATGSSSFIEFLHNKARSFVYSTAVPPMLCAAILRAVPLVLAAGTRRNRLAAHARRVRTALTNRGHTVLPGPGPILPWILETPEATLRASHSLLTHGILAQAIRPPTVPRNTSRLRLVPTAVHQEEDIDRLIAAIAEVRPR